MSDDITKENVYSRDLEMWHSKGTVGTEDESCESVYEKMEEITFEKREYSIILNGLNTGSNQFAIVKTWGGKEQIIGTTKDRYQLIQPIEYVQAYDLAVGKPCETLGFLGTNGEKMFITSKLPSIDIYGDVINLYQFLSVGFDGLYGAHQYVTAQRVICKNTHNIAVADANNSENHGRGDLFNSKHNNTNHMRDLIIWLSYVQNQAEEMVETTKSLFCKMEESSLTVDEAFGLTKAIYPDKSELPSFYPDELREEKEAKIEIFNQKQEESRDLVMNLFKGSGIAINPTGFGLYNSVTEAENHHKPSKKDTTYSLLLGNRQSIMENAMAVIGDWASQN